MKSIVSVSILSADFCNLERDIKRAEDALCDYLHFDVMDGHFVNNISYGIPVLEAVSKLTDMVLDVHLMISEPLKYIENFVKAGADIITFHAESDSDINATIDAIKSNGVKVGLSIKPKTPVADIIPYLEKLDMILLMTVEPGFGGQGFINDVVPKIAELSGILKDKNLNVPIQVDGGVNDKTGAICKEAGADIFVAGSYIYGADDMSKAVESLKR